MVARDAGRRERRRARDRSPPSGAARPRVATRQGRATTKTTAQKLAQLFTDYLRLGASTERFALSTLPPGRFLMPGDLEGSPALTFAPLPVSEGEELPYRSLGRDDGAPLRGL